MTSGTTLSDSYPQVPVDTSKESLILASISSFERKLDDFKRESNEKREEQKTLSVETQKQIVDLSQLFSSFRGEMYQILKGDYEREGLVVRVNNIEQRMIKFELEIEKILDLKSSISSIESQIKTLNTYINTQERKKEDNLKNVISSIVSTTIKVILPALIIAIVIGLIAMAKAYYIQMR